MKIKEIRDLIDFISQSELNEVNIETTDFKISVKKSPDISLNSDVIVPQATAPIPANPLAKAEESTVVESSEGVIAEVKSNLKEIRSPMIGTFYRAANPESPSFIEIGDHVKTGQTVCIIEAMKLFNEIEAEFSGAIVEVLVENGTPVEFDQPLFLVDPTK